MAQTYKSIRINQLPVFCRKMAAWVQDIFCNFYLTKIHKIAKTQQPLKLEIK